MTPAKWVTLGMTLVAVGTGATAHAAPRVASEGPELNRRLEALRPNDPMAYFELAEEVADRAVTDAQRELARKLFGLAGVLDPSGLARSSALALADLAAEDLSRRRLAALAQLLNVHAGVVSPRGSGTTIDPDAGLAVAEALSAYRGGHGQRAIVSLRTPGAEALLDTYSHVLHGGAKRFKADCELYRGGRQKPGLSENGITRMLFLEAAVLSEAKQSWKSDLLLNRGEPLIEVDPTRLDEMFQVDANKNVYRAGRWVTR